jgi:P-type E1-E2 ATPase
VHFSLDPAARMGRPQQHAVFYVAVASSAVTFYWWLSGDKEHALLRTATVLIIACPHPGACHSTVIAVSTSLGPQNGLLIKDRLALERARDLDMVIFDKAGTLTRGSLVVSGIAVAPRHAGSGAPCLRRCCRGQLGTSAGQGHRGGNQT